MATIRVDVVIPAFNAAATIAEAVGSISRQELEAIRIIVVDDGSHDGTADIVQQLATDDPRIILIKQGNSGISAALNRAVAAGDAEFVARQDADDLSDPARLARQIAFLDSHPDVAAVSANHREIDSDGRETGRVQIAENQFRVDPAAVPAAEPPLIQPFMMVRRAALQQAGGYRAFPVSEDTDLYWRLLRQGRLAVIPEVLGSYRLHAASISSASIVDGRIMAACSQVSAVSAQRIAAGEPDLALPETSRAALRAAAEPEGMMRLLAPDATEAERKWLRAASAAKLMELAGYRPFELEASDCRFIRSALAQMPRVSAANARNLAKMTAATAARLARAGRLRDAATLAPAHLWPQVTVRAAANRLYWRKPVLPQPVAAE